VGEPLARMILCYLKGEPRIHLDEQLSPGGFERIEIARLLLGNGNGTAS
jgi:hypothetical protein